MSYTLSYSNGVEGWPSFYSYDPDWMIGMNNFFYTFKGGDLYRHNSDLEFRNTFYTQWTQKFPDPKPNPYTDSRIVSVFNDVPLENKVFKTINLEGDSSWSGTFVTDLQSSGFISAAWFERKEASYFAFIRNNDVGQSAQRSVNGIGQSLTIDAGGSEVNFSISPLVQIGSIISVGDDVYWGDPPSYAFTFAGVVDDVLVNYPAGINQLVIDTTVPGATPSTSDTSYYYYVKNSVAESHGVLGHYCVFDITNSSGGKVELFAVETEAMKSYP